MCTDKRVLVDTTFDIYKASRDVAEGQGESSTSWTVGMGRCGRWEAIRPCAVVAAAEVLARPLPWGAAVPAACNEPELEVMFFGGWWAYKLMAASSMMQQ